MFNTRFQPPGAIPPQMGAQPMMPSMPTVPGPGGGMMSRPPMGGMMPQGGLMQALQGAQQPRPQPPMSMGGQQQMDPRMIQLLQMLLGRQGGGIMNRATQRNPIFGGGGY